MPFSPFFQRKAINCKNTKTQRHKYKHRDTEAQSFIFLSTAHRVHSPSLVCGGATNYVPLPLAFRQTITKLCASVFIFASLCLI